jgi:hypothetical protein
MNYEKRFLEIRDFLKRYEYLHELEMLQRNELPLQAPYTNWINELVKLSQQDLVDIENTYTSEMIINSDFKNFIDTAKFLIDIPQKNINESIIPKELRRKLSLKKEHEISLIKSLLENEEIELFIDIGSGAGHLSSCLLSPKQESICIDMNKAFQKAGIEKLKRWSPKTLTKMKFVSLEVQSASDLSQFSLSKRSMVLGLHACGALSSNLIQLKADRILSFGCCYHKLSREYNLSRIAKISPIWFSNHALTSAAKGYAYLEKEDYSQKFKVKRYRYALHYFLKDKINKDFGAIGNGKKVDYNLSFSDYCYKYSKETLVYSKHELETYFLQKLDFVEFVISSGVLRSVLGRVIEIYLLLDRALYLKENGQNPAIFELFDRKISPRNIAIFV